MLSWQRSTRILSNTDLIETLHTRCEIEINVLRYRTCMLQFTGKKFSMLHFYRQFARATVIRPPTLISFVELLPHVAFHVLTPLYNCRDKRMEIKKRNFTLPRPILRFYRKDLENEASDRSIPPQDLLLSLDKQ